jgi:NADP-dependent 3-hydroxy acid dehydrogenase YdfG
VTGASSGIGAVTAETLAGLGAAVALVARRTQRIEELAAKIVADGGTALSISADVTREAEARGCVERTVAELGRLDTLVNNAGTMLLGPAVGAPLDEWQRMVELNLLGLMYCTHAALPSLLAAAEDSPRQVADLVNVSSIAGRFPRSGSAAYNATKFGVTGFSEAIRQEVTKRHVRVSVLEPGAVETELVSHNRPEVQERHQARFADTRKMEAADIAETIAFVVTRPWYMSVSELVIRPTEQELRWTRMYAKTNLGAGSMSGRSKRILATAVGVVVLGLGGLGIWAATAPDTYAGSGAGCVNVTVPNSTGGATFHYCGSDAKSFCHDAYASTTAITLRARPQCRLAGLGPAASP